MKGKVIGISKVKSGIPRDGLSLGYPGRSSLASKVEASLRKLTELKSEVEAQECDSWYQACGRSVCPGASALFVLRLRGTWDSCGCCEGLGFADVLDDNLLDLHGCIFCGRTASPTRVGISPIDSQLMRIY